RREVLISMGLSAAIVAFSGCGFVRISNLEKILEEIGEKKKEKLREHIRGIQENMVTIKTSTDYVLGYDGKINLKYSNTIGEGLIYRNYILTANHVIELMERDVRENLKKHIGSSFDPNLFTFGKIKDRVTIADEEVKEMIKIPEKDVGIIHYKKPKKPDYEVRLGDSDKIGLLDELYVVGRPFAAYPVVKGGLVGSENQKKFKDFILGGEIITGHRLVGGDSGSPLININGEIVGITSRIITHSHTVSNPINWYKEEIAKYEATQS
ncbi:MAG: trypsin-like peptidase domain-containing protein, partial [Nanoarchaeota archaeon]|nr:trypsin-like peptidase domain-containing protein [Nanoarchaeota archaeon]